MTAAIPIAFSAAEYQRRWDAVLRQLPERGVEAIAVTFNQHAFYLSGTTSASPWVTPLILSPGKVPTYIVRRYDEPRVRSEGAIENVVSYFGDDAVQVWADTLTALGLANATVGFELDRWELAPRDLDLLRTYLPGLRIVDTSVVVQSVMDIKSPEEIALMRRIAALNSHALQAFYGALHEGVTETDVLLSMLAALFSAGSGWPHVQVALGPRTAIPHGGYEPAMDSWLTPGMPAFTEFSATLLGYATAIMRTALLGRHPEVESLHEVVATALQAIEETLMPGVTTGEVDSACRGVVESAGYGALFRHRTGYAINVLWAPLGGGRGATSLTPGDKTIVREGMTFHTPIVLLEPGRFGVGCSETWLVTATGCEALSGLPRDLTIL